MGLRELLREVLRTLGSSECAVDQVLTARSGEVGTASFEEVLGTLFGKVFRV